MKGRRRIYRAHWSITAYLSSNCHIEIFCEEVKERVKKEKKEDKKIKFVNPRKHIRNALAKAYVKKKNSYSLEELRDKFFFHFFIYYYYFY